MWGQRERYQFIGPVLYLKALQERLSPRIVLPESLVDKVIDSLHSDAHFGIAKCFKKVSQRFWYPGLFDRVKDFCKSCLRCAQSKPCRRNIPPLRSMPSGYPFQRVHMDLVGPLVPSSKGNQYILTMTCAFSKWTVAVPLRNEKAVTCARAIFENWISVYGCCDEILTDRGANFQSNLMKELCKLLQIRQLRTTSYRPQANGQVEIFHKSLKSFLRAAVADEPKRWDEMLPKLMLAYRSNVHQSTGYTPFQLVFGREIRLPVDAVSQRPQEEFTQYSNFVSQLKRDLEIAHSLARKHLKGSQNRMKEYFDRGLKEMKLNIGDTVLVFNPATRPGECPKFHRDWSEPHVVLKQLSETTYLVKSTVSHKEKVVNISHLKKFTPRNLDHDGTQAPDQAKRKPKVRLIRDPPPVAEQPDDISETSSSSSDSDDEVMIRYPRVQEQREIQPVFPQRPQRAHFPPDRYGFEKRVYL